MWHECSRPYRPTDEGSFGHKLQVKVYLRVLACSLNNFKPSTSPWVPGVPLWVLWGHYLYTIPSLGRAETTALICLISGLLWLLLSGVGFSGLNEFEVFGVFLSIKSIKVSECYFNVNVFGVTEDCFEIESRKSPSFFFYYHYFKTITLHGLWPAAESHETPEELTPSNVK